uniref:Myosin motor domain-containing protein n=1 Tax=Macrostomum lignano TaxID=282301 RepID=A0A1I8GX21_9PLAT
MRYNTWKLALAELGIPLSDVARILAAILLLGNVAFVDAEDAGPQQLELLGHRGERMKIETEIEI